MRLQVGDRARHAISFGLMPSAILASIRYPASIADALGLGGVVGIGIVLIALQSMAIVSHYHREPRTDYIGLAIVQTMTLIREARI